MVLLVFVYIYLFVKCEFLIFWSVADPGVVKTNIMREVPTYLSRVAFTILMLLRLLQLPKDGVNSILDAALASPVSESFLLVRVCLIVLLRSSIELIELSNVRKHLGYTFSVERVGGSDPLLSHTMQNLPRSFGKHHLICFWNPRFLLREEPVLNFDHRIMSFQLTSCFPHYKKLRTCELWYIKLCKTPS